MLEKLSIHKEKTDTVTLLYTKIDSKWISVFMQKEKNLKNT